MSEQAGTDATGAPAHLPRPRPAVYAEPATVADLPMRRFPWGLVLAVVAAVGIAVGWIVATNVISLLR